MKSFLPTPTKLKLLSLDQVQVRVGIFTLFLGLSVLLPAIIHHQLITGSMINALLFISVAYLNRDQAILLAMLPSTVAISRGLLPLAMAPIMPFIMLANTLLVLVFAQLRNRNQIGAILSASVVKAGFLSLVTFLVMPQLVPGNLADKLQANFTWMQLLTALSGGVIYWLVAQKFTVQRAA